MVWINPKQLQLWWVLCNIYKEKSTIELFDTLLRNIIPLIGVKVQEYGVIMHIKTEWHLPKMLQLAVRYPQTYTGQGCIQSTFWNLSRKARGQHTKFPELWHSILTFNFWFVINKQIASYYCFVFGDDDLRNPGTTKMLINPFKLEWN